MKEFVVYILFSKKYNKTYTGYTSDLIKRFHSHNQLATKGFTIKYRPWLVAYIEFFTNKKEALEREKFLKSGKGRAWVKDKLML
ncbi:GIY-YIG nuclease family protein [uncultured Aquimarina sp.]|uniref:GIY-YIG nuclease family protein n=1 Tax=uncultured Aquimarina sp. TaxID=575652 RepID=UPI0026177645|nr:GIY-YIG nuclease family protein [uncultured Aquimarina sp.]